jgi:hypothetical protein
MSEIVVDDDYGNPIVIGYTDDDPRNDNYVDPNDRFNNPDAFEDPNFYGGGSDELWGGVVPETVGENKVYTYDDGSTLTVDANGNPVSSTNSTDGTGGLARSATEKAANNRFGKEAVDRFKGIPGVTDGEGNVNWKTLFGVGGGLAALLAQKLGSGTTPPVGYTEKVPLQTQVRQQVPGTYDPSRVPGSGGQNYFTKTQYLSDTGVAADDIAAYNDAKATATTEAAGIAALNAANPARQGNTGITYAPFASAPAAAVATKTQAQDPASGVINALPVPKYDVNGNTIPSGFVPPETKTTPVTRAAHGGLMGLKKGTYLRGDTDGMADEIPARIGEHQEARLSDGEFVVPADVVGHLGNGNSDAGAKRLYAMMDKIRKARTGNSKQGKQINPDKFLLA